MTVLSFNHPTNNSNMNHSYNPYPPPPQSYNNNSSNWITPDAQEDDNIWNHHSRMTRTLAHYDVLEQIGEGTYGQVYRALCKDTQQVVALKKIRMHNSNQSMGMPLQQIREIKILKRLQHPNLLRLIEVVTSKGVEHLDPDDEPAVISSNKEHKPPPSIADMAREKYKGNLFLVLEYVPHDLTGLLDINYPFTPVQIKCIVQQLLLALSFLHQHKYIHRDIKSSNILLDAHFKLKLADFGLARSVEPTITQSVSSSSSSGTNSKHQDQQLLTNKVITLWYRPPEILVGAQEYGPAVDIWSAGCILAELCLGKPLFPGKTELDQFQFILSLLGTPADDTWEFLQNGLKKDPKRNVTGLTMPKQMPNRLKIKYEHKFPEPALALLDRMLEWDPRKRITAVNALQHKYFWLEPVAPQDPAQLGLIFQDEGVHFHEFQTKKKRKEAKAAAEEAKEEAILKGRTPEEAQAKFDKVYQSLMKRVAKEGFQQKVPESQGKSAVEVAQTNANTNTSKSKDHGSDKSAISDRKSRGASDADNMDSSRGSSKRNRDKSSKKQHRSRHHDHDRHSDMEEGEEDANHSSKKHKRESDSHRRREGDDSYREARSRSGGRKGKSRKRRNRDDRRKNQNNDRPIDLDQDYGRPRDMDRPRDLDRPRDMDRPRDVDRMRDMDRPRDIDRPRDMERPRGMDRPRETSRLRDMERSRDADRPREIERPRDMDRPRDTSRPKDMESPRDLDRPRGVDRPRDFDRPREMERPRDFDRLRDMDRPRDMDRLRDLDLPRNMDRPKDMERLRDMAGPRDMHRERYDREREDFGRRERDLDLARPRRDDRPRHRDPPPHLDGHYGPGPPDHRGIPHDRMGHPGYENPGHYGRPMPGDMGRVPPPGFDMGRGPPPGFEMGRGAPPPPSPRDGSRGRGGPPNRDRGRRR